MTWTQVSSTDVAAIGWEEASDLPLKGVMGVQFLRPPGSTYIYYEVPRELYEEFLAAPSKGQFVNFTLKRSGLAYERVG